jgi:hypothetical protein
MTTQPAERVEERPAAESRAALAPAAPATAQRRLWLVLGDPLPNRVFFDCGVVDGLRRRLGDQLTPIFPLHPKHIQPWLERLEGLPVTEGEELMPYRVRFDERVVRRLDIYADRWIGFYPLAIRHSLRHGFHRERWVPGHSNSFLDPDMAGPLPRWGTLERWMMAWHFSGRRYVPSVLLRRMRAECDRLVLTNLQAQTSMRFLTAARRLGIPVVGHVASWDHTVGKGVVSPHLARYIVQSETMRDDLERYHGIDPARVVVTGWPQTDVYHRRSSREAYDALLTKLGLEPGKPVLLFAGNTPTNSPYEGNLVARLVDWWRSRPTGDRFSLVFRPHPRDNKVQERFGAALGQPGIGVQEASYTDIGDLATLLQHVDCVVANAGTILLDAIVNDRPSVCVLFDEGAPPGQRWADLNLVGEHYRELTQSAAFYRAETFEELVGGIERALEHPGELAAERRRVAREVVGEVDGRAAERVVDAIVAPIDGTSDRRG